MLPTTEFILRLLLAGVLGGAIGLEREYRAKEAGFRTHFLVALGSALFMLISQYGFMELLTDYAAPGVATGREEDIGLAIRLDPSRIASQVVTGIGFIGAGTIIFQKHVVHGLTTAAGLWVTAAIGMGCGSGLYLISFAATLFVFLALEAMNFLLRRMGVRRISVKFSAPTQQEVDLIMQRLRRIGAEVENYKSEERPTASGPVQVVAIEVKILRRRYRRRLVDFMSEFDGVKIEEME